MAKPSLLEMFLALLSDDERKQFLAELSTMALNGNNNVGTKIKQKVPLGKQLPEGVDATKIKKISIYPHYIPKGYTAEDVEYDNAWGQYVIRNGKKATLVYIPIHTVLSSIPFFTQQYEIYGEIGERHLRNFASNMYRKEGEELKFYFNSLHQHFIDCLSECPKIKGVWIVSAYPTITEDNEIEFLDSYQIEYNKDFPHFSRLVPFSEKYLEKFEENFPEYQIVTKNIYYALVAYVIKKFYEYYMSNGCMYYGNLNIYFTFLMGTPADYFMDEEAKKFFLDKGIYAWRRSDRPNIYEFTYTLEVWQQDDYSFRDYCRVTCNIPLVGPVSIAVKDEETQSYIVTKKIHAISDWNGDEKEKSKVGLLVDANHKYPTTRNLDLPATSFIAMLKED